MGVLLSLMLAAAGAARVETVGVATVQARPALRVQWSGSLGRVAVQRDGDVAKVSLEGAGLGALFSGASRFEWKWANLLPSDFPIPSGSAPPDSVRMEEEASSVTLSVHLAPGGTFEVQRGRGQLIFIFNPPRADAPPAGPVVAAAASPEPPRSAAASVVVAVASEPSVAPVPLPPPAPREPAIGPSEVGRGEPIRVASLDADRLKSLFPIAPSEAPAATPDPAIGLTQSAELEGSSDAYKKLFPAVPEQATPQAGPGVGATSGGRRTGEPEQAFSIGVLRLRPWLSANFVDADVNLRGPQPVGDRYLQFQPGLTLQAPVLDGRLSLDYQPSLRAFGSFEPVQSRSQRLNANLDMPVGSRVWLKLVDHFATGVLETAEVDPGHEYFFDLGRFNRHAAGINARFEVDPRLNVEVGASGNRVRFDETSGFFDYDSRALTAGLGFDLSPNLHALVSYVYDWVPTPEPRPEAEAHAHSGQVSLNGDLLPLLHGQLAVGYRDQTSPQAGDGGQRFRGLVLSGSLIRELGQSSSLGLTVNRSTPVSKFEENGFYLSNSVQATFMAPLPLSLSLESGAGYLWNEYRIPARALGRPREDRVFGWFAGLKRPVTRWADLSAVYRRDRRSSNLSEFDSVVEGLVLRLDVNFFARSR